MAARIKKKITTRTPTTRARPRSRATARQRPIAPAPATLVPTAHRRNWWLLAIALIAVLVLFSSYAAKNAYEDWRVLGVVTTHVRYTVTSESRIGFALGTGDIAFGKIVPGGGGTRTATLTAAEPTIAVLTLSPDLERVLRIDPNPVLLEPDAPVNVTFDLTVPVGTALGNYTGDVIITYLRQLPWE